MSYVVLQAAAGFGADAFESQCVSVPIGGGQTRQLCGPLASPPMNTCDPRGIQAALSVTGQYVGPIDGDLSTQPSTAAIAGIINKYGLPGVWDYAFPSAAICSGVARDYMGFLARKDRVSQQQVARQRAALQSGAASLQVLGKSPRKTGKDLQQAALDAQRGSRPPPVTSGDGSNSGYLPGTSPLTDPAYNPPSSEMEAWWNNQSTTKKVLIVGGVAAALFGVVKLVQYVRKPAAPPRMTPNARRGRGRRRRSHGRRGRIISFHGRRLGRTKAPARYRRLGFTKPSQYAWPTGFMYPVGNAKYTRAAASKFAKWRHRYPPKMQHTIATRIDAAKRRFRIGEYR